ncbi:MAG: PEP-CTERM sorting domain-containing protein [Fimbriimonadaceae bacterium]|nr:PEP-CTERM sorting domain-containing protein [Fimbriimonadaceae bacterium]
MKNLLFTAFLLVSTTLADAQYWAGNTGHELIPGQDDISNSTVADGPFAGWAGFMSGGQFQNGATNKFAMEFLAGTTDQGGKQGRRGPAGVNCDVDDENQQIGTVTFDYGGMDGYVRVGSDDKHMSGMMMRGGITLDPGFKLSANHQFRWVQAYQETKFDGTVGSWTVDSPDPATSPLYTNYIAPNPNGVGNMAAALVDVPFDSDGLMFKTLDFVSYLVCYDLGTKDIGLLGSFRWGFTHEGNATDGSTGLKSDYLTIYQDGVYSQYNDFKDALGKMSPGWTTFEGCDGCVEVVPEPASLAGLGVMGLAALARRRRRSA